jgi:hypothetical protein
LNSNPSPACSFGATGCSVFSSLQL